MKVSFEWDEAKNYTNFFKHGISFEQAQYVFTDPNILILRDERHSTPDEERHYAVGRIDGGIVTVRFTLRGQAIRIFGAGFWTKYRRLYLDRLT